MKSGKGDVFGHPYNINNNLSGYKSMRNGIIFDDDDGDSWTGAVIVNRCDLSNIFCR